MNDTGWSFLGVLGLVFLILKLVGTITWSWWWVLLPWYGPAMLVLFIMVFGFLAMCVAVGLDR